MKTILDRTIEKLGQIPYLRGDVKTAIREGNPTHAITVVGRIRSYTEDLTSRGAWGAARITTKQKLLRRLNSIEKQVYGETIK
ncbi:MAG: hypothetical protein PVJ67_00950 [Candidatus Pacearchaeota archaeon]|jgi:hypothetical protein